MKFWKKTLPFLVLNVIVSAAAMLAVLWFWQQQNDQSVIKPIFSPTATSTSLPTDQPKATSDSASISEDSLLSIEGVFGAGDLNVEYILIRNQSETSVNLNGWSVSSMSGETYDLPYLVLNKNGAVRLYSKHGVDSVIELYWNSDQALWDSGDEIHLLDQSGQLQAAWQVP